LEALRIRARIEKIFPMIETQVADLERTNGSKIKPETIDLVLISNILFQTENKINILKEAKRILVKDGFLVVID
jgi:ubiquinone/menaquinone biosynthesis C-methylase UbiE